jgi:large conductance mechanosensitive channel
MGFMKEFMEFMEKQNIISVALAFIVGIATATLVQALVKDLITPIYAPYTAVLNATQAVSIGPSNFFVGDFIQNLISWIVILLVVFFLGRWLIKEKKEEKK